MPQPPLLDARVRLPVYALIGLIWLGLPGASIPLHWIEVFFHELSHALVAVLSGARVRSIELNLDGSGLATYSGACSGCRPFVTFAGYFGATLFGALLYRLGVRGGQSASGGALSLALLTGSIVISMLLWGRDLETLLIAGAIILFLVVASRIVVDRFSGPLFGVIGAAVMLSSLTSVTSLLGADDRNDAQSLSQQLLLPSFVWVGLWIGWAILVALWVYRRDQRSHPS